MSAAASGTATAGAAAPATAAPATAAPATAAPATAAPAANSKKPRTRAYAPKVRTGCATCKIRRKKCDEGKPTCRRCRDGGYLCDGYPQVPAVAGTMGKKQTAACERAAQSCNNCGSSSSSLVAAASSSAAAAATAAPVARCMIPGNALEQYYLNHFFACTVNDLMDRPASAAFWNNAVFATLEQHSSCSFIQPAIAALGATHWLFMTGLEDGSIPRVKAFASSQYSKSIANLIPCMTNEAGASTDVVSSILTCCLLFVLLESLRGNQAEALRHLEAGSRLIADRARPRQVSDPSPCSLNGNNHNKSWQWLIAMFHSIGTQATLFSDCRLLPDLKPLLGEAPWRQPDCSPTPPSPFQTLDEASHAMDRLDDLINGICWDIHGRCGGGHGGDEEDAACCPRDCGCAGCTEWARLERAVRDWSCRFKPLAGKLLAHGDSVQRQRVLRLQLLERLWLWEVEDDDADHDDIDKDKDRDDDCLGHQEAAEMLDLAEQILLLSASRPTFSLSADTIPSIISVYQNCPDMQSRRRAIDLLRSHQRREVIFSSHQVADYLEHHMSKLSLGAEPKDHVDDDNADQDWLEIGPSSQAHALIEFRPRLQSSSP